LVSIADDLVLALEHRGQVERDLALTPCAANSLACGEVLAGLEQRLAGDAADAQAGAAEGGLRSTQATLRPSWAARMAAT
jgi:hypothetical protein